MLLWLTAACQAALLEKRVILEDRRYVGKENDIQQTILILALCATIILVIVVLFGILMCIVTKNAKRTDADDQPLMSENVGMFVPPTVPLVQQPMQPVQISAT